MSAQVKVDFSWVQWGTGVWDFHAQVLNDKANVPHFDDEDIVCIHTSPFTITFSCEQAAKDYIWGVLSLTHWGMTQNQPTFGETEVNNLFESYRI